MNIWVRILITIIKSFFQSKVQASQILRTAKAFAALNLAPGDQPVPRYAMLWTESEAKLREAVENL